MPEPAAPATAPPTLTPLGPDDADHGELEPERGSKSLEARGRALLETLAELGRKLGTARAELAGERREVAVVFADLCGYTAISERLDPEEIGLLVNRLLQELAGSVRRYGGHVDKFIGDAVMALFGAPVAHEDDPERAVLAALDMLEVMRRHNAGTDTPLGLRIGINLGEVVAGHVSDGQGLAYTVMGDAVNVASRLQSEADPDTILISESVFRRLSRRFLAERLDLVSVRGRSEPIQPYRVTGLREPPPEAVHERAPFVGREADLAALHDFFRRIDAGRGGVLLVDAEPGTGKTRLVREALEGSDVPLLALETGFSAIRLPGQRPALADLFQQIVPEEPAGRGVVERALSFLGAAGESQRLGIEGLAREADPSTDGPPDAAGEAFSAQRERWSALAALLRKAAASRPVLVWIEDVHWIDEATQEFIDFLVPLLRDRRIGLLLTSRIRPADVWIPPGAERLQLAPLEAGAAERLLESLLAGVDAASRRDLLARGAGNPLFLEELARAVAQALAAGQPLTALPSSLQGLLVSRIDRLDPPGRLLLQMASVLGVRFPTRLLKRMYALEGQPLEFEAAAAILEREGFLEVELNGDVRHRFHHALVQEAAYGGLLLRLRKVLHESAARLGEMYYAGRLDAEAAFFAHHYWEAGLPRDAAPHLWIAGRRAADSHELAAAERFLARAESVLEEHPDVLAEDETRAAFLETYGDVLLHRGRLDEAEPKFHGLEELGQRTGRREWRARGLEYHGRVAWQRGKLAEALAFYERALAELPERSGPIAADLHNGLGIIFYYRREAEVALGHHQRALRLREDLGDRLGLAKSLCNIGNVLFDLEDDLERSREHYLEALEHARAVGDRRMRFSAIKNLAGVAVERGEWEYALGLLDEAEGLQEEMGWSFAGYLTLQSRAECEIALGRVADALRHLEACLGEGDGVLEPINRVRTRLFLFDAYLRAMQDERAASALREAAELALQLEVVRDKEADLALREGRLAAAGGDWTAAARAFARAEEAARSLGYRALERIARAHLRRAQARRPGELPAPPRPATLAFDERGPRRPLEVLVAYLEADAAALGAGGPEDVRAAAQALAEAGDQAAALGETGLARAAFEREAEARDALGDHARRDAARAHAGSAMSALAAYLPGELRGAFMQHPRNAALAPASRG